MVGIVLFYRRGRQEVAIRKQELRKCCEGGCDVRTNQGRDLASKKGPVSILAVSKMGFGMGPGEGWRGF